MKFLGRIEGWGLEAATHRNVRQWYGRMSPKGRVSLGASAGKETTLDGAEKAASGQW